jgi:ribosome-binding factor A
MDKPNRRLARLNEQFRREITAILRRAVRDPRVSDVVVNSVEVTSDLWLARVYVRVGGDDQERAEALQGLGAAANFIRRELAAVLHIRRIPELRFMEDKTLARASRIEEILKGLDGAGEQEAGEPGEEDADELGQEEDDGAGEGDDPGDGLDHGDAKNPGEGRTEETG